MEFLTGSYRPLRVPPDNIGTPAADKGFGDGAASVGEDGATEEAEV